MFFLREVKYFICLYLFHAKSQNIVVFFCVAFMEVERAELQTTEIMRDVGSFGGRLKKFRYIRQKHFGKYGTQVEKVKFYFA